MPVEPTQYPIILPCNCHTTVDHFSGDALRTCQHGNWKIKARVIVEHVIEPATSPSTIQQARARSRAIDESLSQL